MNKAVAMVEVARSTSIITTVACDALYKCSKAGDIEVYRKGLALGISKIEFIKIIITLTGIVSAD